MCDTPFKYKSYYYIIPTITLSDLPFHRQFEGGMSERGLNSQIVPLFEY